MIHITYLLTGALLFTAGYFNLFEYAGLQGFVLASLQGANQIAMSIGVGVILATLFSGFKDVWKASSSKIRKGLWGLAIIGTGDVLLNHTGEFYILSVPFLFIGLYLVARDNKARKRMDFDYA